MSLDYKGLPERFFSLFPRYKQREIAERLYPGENGAKKQPQISKWMKGQEPIPMEALDRVVDLGIAKWEWLLTGQGGEKAFPNIQYKLDKKRGKRLEESLEKLIPNKSWIERNRLLEIPDSTVIAWRNGQEISCAGLSRLFDVGCDIVYILTGKKDLEHTIKYKLSVMQPKEIQEEIEHLRTENAILKQKNFPQAESSGERDAGDTGQAVGDPNFNQKPGISFDKGGADDLAYGEKGDMMDLTGVEFLKDHLATLKQDKADLLAKVAVLEKELADLREKVDTLQDENKRLLTLSPERDTRQAGSA